MKSKRQEKGDFLIQVTAW